MIPSHTTFRASPATLVIDRPNGEELWIGASVYWEPDSDPPIVLCCQALGEIKWFPCSTLEEVAPEMWKGQLWTDSGADVTVTVRPTLESDTISAISMAGGPRVPMPLAVISAYHEYEGIPMPTLWAMSDEDGFVATMMLNTEQGLYVRASNAWHLLTDEDVVDGLNVDEVADTGLDMFDQFDRAGQLVHITAMPRGEVSDMEATPVGADAAPALPLTASFETRHVPMLASVDDLPAAIAVADANPDLRWWVERRIKALGLEASLPWA